MRKLIPFLLIAAVPTAAYAEDEVAEKPNCSALAMASIQGDYPLSDLGLDGSDGKPVGQHMLAVTCGKWLGNVWLSHYGSKAGKFGHRGSGDEIDFELAYADSTRTPIGDVKYTLYGGYYVLDLGDGFGSGRDYVKVYAEVERPIKVGPATVKPFVRATRMIGLGGEEDFSIFSLGARANVPVTLPIIGSASLSGEARHNWNGASFAPNRVWYGEAFLNKSLGSGWGVSGGVKVAGRLSATPVFKVTKAITF